ncbi:MAG: biotin--[acetyl-CoA-carboxylase] ligase [Verrucomicrobiae bacterium]|nr:biotin--[acetyl-CoA-carboxylase] ligase [Verrucomicrobiae bacterium]
MSLDAQLLAAFREADEGHMTARDLASRLGVSSATVSRRIHDLRQLGFDIEHHAQRGYRVVAWPDKLLAEDIKLQLGETVIGREVLVYDKTTSTNDVAEKLGLDGAPEGVVVFAETQTRGRGRMGRPWASPRAKGLWFSVLLRPKLPMRALARLPIAASVAVAHTIRERTGLHAEIKWPNDILIGGRKCAGILAEMQAELDALKFVVLGIGLDVNCDAGDFPPEVREIATSLRIESGRDDAINRSEMAVALLRELDLAYTHARGDFETLRQEWGRLCSTLGKRVMLQVGPRRLEGVAQALDENGALLVRRDDGRTEHIMSGDVVTER